jgi:hypothetical protein
MYYSVNGEWIDGSRVGFIEPLENGRVWGSNLWYASGPH